MLALWYLRCLRSTDAHYKTAMVHKEFDRWLTITNVISSIGVLCASLGKTLFESVVNGHDLAVTIFLAVASVVVVISSILQYVLNGGALSTSHHEAGIRYSALKRKIEVMLTRDCTDDDAIEVMNHLNDAAEASVLVPRKTWRKDDEKRKAVIREIEAWLAKSFRD